MARLDEVTSEVRRQVGNADFSFQITDRLVVPNAAFTASRTGTLPLAASVAAGRTISLFDELPAIAGANVVTVARSGTDTINGGVSYVCSQPRGLWQFVSDGVSKWSVAQEKQPIAATLSALSGLTTTAFGRARLGDTDSAAARLALGAQASLGFMPVQQGGGTGQSNSKIYVGWGTGGGLKAQVDTTDLGIVWTDYSAPRSHAAIGYQTLPSGLIVQWGALDVTLNSAGDAAVTFPAAFANACYSCVVSSGFDVYATGRPIGLRESATTTGFVISVRANPGVGTARINFMAIGK